MTIGPVGSYCDQLITLYDSIYGMKQFSKAPKQRRDKGISKSSSVEGTMKRIGAKDTESSFIRRREAASKTVALMPAGSVHNKLKHTAIGATVPADTDKCVTEAVRKRRAENADRIDKRIAAIPGEAPAAVQGSVGVFRADLSSDSDEDLAPAVKKRKSQARWSQSDRSSATARPRASDDKIAAATARPRLQGYFAYLAPGCGMSDTQAQELERLGCKHTTNFFTFVKFGADYDRRIIILKKWSAESMDDPHTLVGKIFGGYLTTSTEVIASMKKEGKSALGVWVKGLQGCGVKVFPTEKLRASEPHARLIDVLNALALRPRKPPIQILDKPKQMRRSYAEYVKEHGLQCRPLVKHAVLALDKQDAKDVQKKNRGLPRHRSRTHRFLGGSLLLR